MAQGRTGADRGNDRLRSGTADGGGAMIKRDDRVRVAVAVGHHGGMTFDRGEPRKRPAWHGAALAAALFLVSLVAGLLLAGAFAGESERPGVVGGDGGGEIRGVRLSPAAPPAELAEPARRRRSGSSAGRRTTPATSAGGTPSRAPAPAAPAPQSPSSGGTTAPERDAPARDPKPSRPAKPAPQGPAAEPDAGGRKPPSTTPEL